MQVTMSKQVVKSIIAAALILGSTAPAMAGTYYVCNGTAFTLTAGTTTGLTEFEWKEGASVVGTTEDLPLTLNLTDATTAETFTYTYRVKEADCWSDPVTHTVVVLPAPTVTISDATAAYCSNVTVNSTLTAVPGTLSGLPAGSAYTYTWTGGISTTDALDITAAGTYGVTLVYDLTGVTPNDGAKISACTDNASVTITPATAPTAPAITIL